MKVSFLSTCLDLYKRVEKGVSRVGEERAMPSARGTNIKFCDEFILEALLETLEEAKFLRFVFAIEYNLFVRLAEGLNSGIEGVSG